MQRGPEFGEDVDIFRPERWLEADAEPDRRRKMEKTVDIIFGSGRWACLGKSIVYIELNKIFFEVWTHSQGSGQHIPPVLTLNRSKAPS